MEVIMTTSELLKQYRLRANKTQKEWAGSAISPSFYSKVEKGLNHISADDLINLLDYNGISAAEFFGNLKPKKKLQYEREQELIKLLNDVYYQNSSSELERLKHIIEHEKLPNQKLLSVLVNIVSALMNNSVEKLDSDTKSVIKDNIFRIDNFDFKSLSTYCSFMRFYDLDSNLLITRKIIRQFQTSTDVRIQSVVLGIIANLLFLCIEKGHYEETDAFIQTANSIPTRPESFFYKNILFFLENFINYHFTGNYSYLEKCQKSIDIISALNMVGYSKELTRFITENK